MDPLERIRSVVPGFGGYDADDVRRTADEDVRSFVGERLAVLPGTQNLEPAGRDLYDRVLSRCEFRNQAAFARFELDPNAVRVGALLDADSNLLDALQALESAPPEQIPVLLGRIDRAFDRRDAAMEGES